MSLLRVDDVSKHFGSLIAVDGVSLAIEPGELRAIIGPNGAGKTTFFNLISGFFAPIRARSSWGTRTSPRCRRRRELPGAWRARFKSLKFSPNSASPTIFASRSRSPPAMAFDPGSAASRAGR